MPIDANFVIFFTWEIHAQSKTKQHPRLPAKAAYQAEEVGDDSRHRLLCIPGPVGERTGNMTWLAALFRSFCALHIYIYMLCLKVVDGQLHQHDCKHI